MIGQARAEGAVSLVNAIASGKGATVAVDLPTFARVEIEKRPGKWRTTVNETSIGSVLAVQSVRKAAEMAGVDPGGLSGEVQTRVSAPIGVGLKTSSSSSVAIILATLSALGERAFRAEEILRCSASAALAAGVSVTGAMDDAASCLLGGVNFANNSEMELLASKPLGERKMVLIKVPAHRSRRGMVPSSRVRQFAGTADSIFYAGLRGAIWKAMILNGLLYSSVYGYPSSDALQALEAGALGAGLSGTGPAVCAVFEGRRELRRLARRWKEKGARLIETETSDGGAAAGA